MRFSLHPSNVSANRFFMTVVPALRRAAASTSSGVLGLPLKRGPNEAHSAMSSAVNGQDSVEAVAGSDMIPVIRQVSEREIDTTRTKRKIPRGLPMWRASLSHRHGPQNNLGI